jgi:hypothetical protein
MVTNNENEDEKNQKVKGGEETLEKEKVNPSNQNMAKQTLPAHSIPSAICEIW